MMYKFKIIPKLLGVLAFLMLTNCSKEQYNEQIYDSKGKNNISIEQFKRETGLINFDETIKIEHNSNSLQARNPDGSYELSDFIIDTDIIKKYVVDEKTTYSFKIIPTEVVNEKIYNLIYFYKEGWQTIILELEPTEANLLLLKQGLTEKFEGTVTRLYQSDMPSPVEQWCVTFSFTNYNCNGCTGECDLCYLCVSSGTVTICGTDEASVLYLDAGPSSSGGGPGNGSGGNGNPSSSNPTDPEIAIIPNLEELEIDIDGNPNTVDDATNIRRLNKLTKNKTDGTKTNIKQRIDQLKGNLATSLKENGYMFDGNQNTLPSFNQTSNGTFWSNGGQPQYHVMLHMHQNNYIPEGTTTPVPTNVAPSDTDTRSILSLLDYTNNINTTSIIVNRLGTFAIRVSDKEQAQVAFDEIEITNEENPDWVKFVDEYDRLVIKPYETIPLDDNAVMDGFIEFINTNLVNGQPMGLSFYQAVYDAQGNIINWVKI